MSNLEKLSKDVQGSMFQVQRFDSFRTLSLELLNIELPLLGPEGSPFDRCRE